MSAALRESVSSKSSGAGNGCCGFWLGVGRPKPAWRTQAAAIPFAAQQSYRTDDPIVAVEVGRITLRDTSKARLDPVVTELQNAKHRLNRSSSKSRYNAAETCTTSRQMKPSREVESA